MLDKFIIKKYIEGMEIRYTIGDLIALGKIISKKPWVLNNTSYADEYDLMLMDLKKSLQMSETANRIANDKLARWIQKNFQWHGPNNFKSQIVLFIFHTSLEEVPLNINDELLAPFANWRLRIAK